VRLPLGLPLAVSSTAEVRMRLESEGATATTPTTAAGAVERLAESVTYAQIPGLNERSGKDANPKHEKLDLSVVSARATIVAELAKRIRPKLGSEMPEAVQAELATLLGLVPEATSSHSLCPCEFEIAVDALLADKPKLELARGLRMKLEEQMWAKRFGGRLIKALPATRVVLGLLVTTTLLIPALIWSTCMHFADAHPETMDADLLVLVCCFGAFGAVSSIMVRLRSFDSIHAPPITLFLTGLFRPLIGALFAAFALVLIESHLLNLPEATLVYSALAIAFVAGFSERFGKDLTSIVAHRVEAPRPRRQEAPAA
jgi:hypothetical protein